ncbi:hypothetical protein [Nonomuraea turcica]|uniref:hypothetical protein n=1 Tax=Nonomuraea sp. G32 TaxID=3067274 RepID=UPI00273AD1ED|nr:hypothetical protein [Nonomuraea sp. G32]MDP4506569.1 hypothetical protein [Nonomuraea sp. G32]
MAQASTNGISKGFLLTESAAAAGPVMEDEESWKISNNLSRQLELNPCGRKTKPRDGRVAMRTITYESSAPSSSSEQLVLYRNTKSAQAAFRKLQRDLAKCRMQAVSVKHHGHPWYGYIGKPLRAGDEGLSVASYYYNKKRKRVGEALDLTVVARRGAALFFYTDAGNGLRERKKIVSQAKKMATKVCDLPGVCE